MVIRCFTNRKCQLYRFSRPRYKTKTRSNQKVKPCFAVRKGLEPSTSGVTGRHSNQLNYHTKIKKDPHLGSNADAKIVKNAGYANFF